MDQLPESVTDPLRGAIVTRLDPHEIVRAVGSPWIACSTRLARATRLWPTV
jgi:hypothetical protein